MRLSSLTSGPDDCEIEPWAGPDVAVADLAMVECDAGLSKASGALKQRRLCSAYSAPSGAAVSLLVVRIAQISARTSQS